MRYVAARKMKIEAMSRLTTNVATNGTYLTASSRGWALGPFGPSALGPDCYVNRAVKLYSAVSVTGSQSQMFQKIVGARVEGEMFWIFVWSNAVTAGNWKMVTP
jgi:hypothetical protein